MVKVVFALCLFINGSLVEHRIQDSLSTCLKMKREATRNMEMKNKQFIRSASLLLILWCCFIAVTIGKGKIIIKSKVKVEDTALIIEEIPYEVNKADLVRKIDDIRIQKKKRLWPPNQYKLFIRVEDL